MVADNHKYKPLFRACETHCSSDPYKVKDKDHSKGTVRGVQVGGQESIKLYSYLKINYLKPLARFC